MIFVENYRHHLLKKRVQRVVRKLRNQMKAKRRIIKDLCLQKKELQRNVTDCKSNETHPCDTFKDKGVFSDKIRLCIIELLSLEVSVSKVSKIIKVVSQHICNIIIPLNRLPSITTVLKISDEGQYLMKLFIAEKMELADTFGWSKDGTSRRKRKILENTVTLGCGKILPIGFHAVARETADDISTGVKRELAELSAIFSGSNINSDLTRKNFLSKLSYFMTDRAANEKLSNLNLIKWIREELKDDAQPVHALYCMARVLGFHTYSSESLFALQKEVESKDETKLGRDANPLFKFFRSENVAVRLIRMTSQIFGPNGDEKCGIRDKWLTNCHRQKEFFQ